MTQWVIYILKLIVIVLFSGVIGVFLIKMAANDSVKLIFHGIYNTFLRYYIINNKLYCCLGKLHGHNLDKW